MRSDMSDDSFDLDIADQSHHDLLVLRPIDGDSVAGLDGREKAPGPRKVPKIASNGVFLQTR